MISSKEELLQVKNAKHLHDYYIELVFNTGEKKIINLENQLYGRIFKPLKNKEFFKKFFISSNTIEWENGADFAPEFLYKEGV